MTLEEARNHDNEGVVYKPHGGPAEDGVITWVSDRYVFVRYSGDQHSKATDASVLTLTRAQREELFGEYRGALLLAAGLSDETEPWHEYAPDLASRRPEDRQAIAAERAEKGTAGLLHTLMNGNETGE